MLNTLVVLWKKKIPLKFVLVSMSVTDLAAMDLGHFELRNEFPYENDDH